MDLVALPCPAELAAPFLARVPSDRFDALVLEKQAAALGPALRAKGAREVVALPESLYGRVTQPATRAALRRLTERRHARAFFPVNSFGGNVALLLAALADEVAAVSATAEPPLALPLPAEAPPLPPPARGAALEDLQSEIARRLAAPDGRLEALDGAARTGERPTAGLVAGFPYDAEVLARYAAAAGRVRGRVVELGAGLGGGAWLLTQLDAALSLRGFDCDSDAVALATARFGGGRLSFAEGRAEATPLPDGAADGLVSFEVLEHLADPARLVREARRLLVPGGVFFGSTPDHRLYPYRVHDGRPGTPAEVRARGAWPWHVTALDPAAVGRILDEGGFSGVTIGWPTWTTGLRALPAVRAAADLDTALDVVAGLTWSVADFAVLDTYVPVFSGFSFVFSAVKG